MDGESPAGAVFLSYASQDADAAKRICEALRAAGIEVWFDQSELRGGDAWDHKIRQQIRDCALFIPIISANTQARPEGYFRLEWRLADQRTHLMGRSKAFLLPVCVDGTIETEADVPDSFSAVQWTRLHAGDTPPAFVQRVSRLLSPEQSRPPAESGASFGAAPAPRQTAISPAAPRRGQPVLLLVAAVAVIGVGYFAVDKFVLSKRRMEPVATSMTTVPPVQSMVSDKSIAVLPFVNMSSDTEQEYFSDGVTEELINALSRFSGLHVAARTSSFAFKGKNEDIRAIGKKLNVGAVLEGSVSKEGNRVRITAQLISTADGYHLWSDSYDRELKDIFEIRSQVAQTVAAALQVALQAGERQTVESKPTVDIEAYRLYLRGRHSIATYTEQGLSAGVRDLQQAISRDPGYALAYLGLAYYYVVMLDWIPGKDALARGRAAADKALELDPTLAEAHSDLGWIRWMHDYDHEGARREFQTALKMQPRLAPAHEFYGWYLISVGETDAGLAESRRAVELDPLSPEANTVLGFNLLFARRYDEAIRQLRSAVAVDPDYFWSHEYLGRALAQKGQWAEALAELRTARALPGSFVPEIDSAIGRAYADKGDRAEALKVLSQLEDNRRRSFVPAYALAVVQAGLGDSDNAFRLLEESYSERGLWMSWVGVDPDLDRLRSDPRFKTLLRKVGLPR